ncbi:MAG: DUF1080 domain-containing protein [Dysgonamonadaceae bacterium]|jgi:hypothetical protein|nr:DUF1080 domain-containing protein [Dysgonamonadaceae bacterium]
MKKVSYFVSIVAAASMIFACSPKKKAEQVPAEPQVEEAPPVDPKLVAEGPYETLIPATADDPAYVLIEKPQVSIDELSKDKDGYISIFDGKTFSGWRGYGKDAVPGKWVIEDEAIKFSGSGAGEAQSKDGGDLIFAHKFKNFRLKFDWKVDKGSNSGVFILAREVKGEPVYISSPEYQILDNENHPDAIATENGNRKSASLYDMIPAKPQNSKPYGEWNTGEIIVDKGSVFHFQNGKKVVEYHLWTPQWDELINSGKFKKGGDFPLAFTFLSQLGGENREGYIGLQDHGDVVWFKNIKVKVTD